MLLDRDTNKYFDKDITEYLDKYQNKHINKYKAKLINKHENKSIDKYKNQVHQEVHPSTVTSGAALAPLPCLLHTAPTPPPRRSHAAPTLTLLQLLQRRAHTVRNATATSPSRSAQPSRSPRPAARSSHAALTPAERLLYAASTPLAHRCNAAAKLPLCSCIQPSHRPHAALTPGRCTRLLTVPTPPPSPSTPPTSPYTSPHTAATPPSRRPHAAARCPCAALAPLHAALTPPPRHTSAGPSCCCQRFGRGGGASWSLSCARVMSNGLLY